ncbi:flagellar basal body P-ring protein FlgI [Legionella israelensis]|uniref:Flagellar P-ring protein n=1 Tax=Legionella israelensis TaxID=454 RepID=A0A0W0VYE6_9GAMM|nr:flagellar basal body P-ring protein FlgI [Legionella israelensis]KTD24994.1 flagellar P-ring protein (precursor) FlgI [Legionella israelensis]QBR83995.1 flagellar basal body P-ring protein FlgI [Legionella israelensis]QBS10880.1 flagellar basal body P-ring protein FlgI [Legionella israelensis]SCX80524.1 flagellar P-ring protein precursor FlgI [Legionella israelensis DSM 19235]STX57864.1 flagellar P-ring protein (precursor) FlgI [Legionella israelensis]
MFKCCLPFVFLLLFFPLHAEVRLKSLTHISGLQENTLTGYGLVIGLAGSGDSRRNKDTTQAIANLLQSFGVNLSPSEINSRNSATVIVTTKLPPLVHQGDKIDVNVSSLGDARSLLGGTLLVTPLKGADDQIYALAQGPISIGGFKYDLFGNVIQKNHPTTGMIPGGAVVEKSLYTDLTDKSGIFHLILNRPDFTTADLIEVSINQKFGINTALARSAQDIEIHPPQQYSKRLIRFISQLENIVLTPDNIPTIVVNERTGVVIAGADVKLDAVTISHGNLHIAISTEYNVSQPTLIRNVGPQVHTSITPSTNIQVRESNANTVQLKKEATVADLIAALNKVKTSTRDIISILESLQRAGALHAELIIQ